MELLWHFLGAFVAIAAFIAVLVAGSYAFDKAISPALTPLFRLFRRDNRQWTPVTIYSDPVQLIDGTSAAGRLMTRTIKGQDQFRRLTAAEAQADYEEHIESFV